jgi:hypothetical protein
MKSLSLELGRAGSKLLKMADGRPIVFSVIVEVALRDVTVGEASKMIERLDDEERMSAKTVVNLNRRDFPGALGALRSTLKKTRDEEK